MSGQLRATPDIMVDLETFGTRPGSVIASIGAVAFDAETGWIGESFYRVVDVRSCQALGLTLDADTVLWWLKQSEEARAALNSSDAVPLHTALLEFGSFYTAFAGRRLWGHGGNFDEPMLVAAFRAAGLTPTWRFSASRCTRTIFELADVWPDRKAGVHHNALSDAIAQAQAVILARRRLALATGIAAIIRGVAA